MQWFCFKPNLLSLIDQIHGDSSQILDLGFSFSFSEMGKEITSRAQEITPVEPQMAGGRTGPAQQPHFTSLGQCPHHNVKELH